MIETNTSPLAPSRARQEFDWRLFAAGLILLLVAAASALPFMQALQTLTEDEPSISDLALFGAQVLLAGAAALALGLYLGRRVGLGLALIPRRVRLVAPAAREPAGRQLLHVLQLALAVAILGAVGATTQL